MHELLAALSVVVLSFTPPAQTPPPLSYTAPKGWQARPAASTMRIAEFVVPHLAGDAEDAELIVYFFGGSGGSAAANIDRWVSQMQQPDGSPSQTAATRGARTVNGLKISTIDLDGTYVAEVRPGASERNNKPGFRLRAAVVETARGPYYIKMTGPVKTMQAAAADYEAFLSSLR